MEALRELSGQKKHILPSEIDHTYARPWFKKLNPTQKYPCRLTKFIFLRNFPRHYLSKNPHAFLNRHDGLLEVGDANDLKCKYMDSIDIKEGDCPDIAIDTSMWTQQKDRLYSKTMQILQQHYLSTVVFDKLPYSNTKIANLMEDTSIQLRHTFSSIAGWDNELLIWLNNIILSETETHDHLIPVYHETIQYLSLKMPALINKFYSQLVPQTEISNRILLDPFNEDLPPISRLPCNPIILLVPGGPSKNNSSRMDYWKILLASLGQLVNINVPYKPDQTAPELLQFIKFSVRDKIRDLKKKKTNETRPLVLVGFNQGSLIAIHAAIENPSLIQTVICLGFPMLSINGHRGDLDDPIVDMITPVLFIIGQLASMASLDGLERLRELMSRSDTGLVYVGGCNEKLVIRTGKKLHDCITQGMVDRCIAEEIYEYINSFKQEQFNVTDK